MDRISYYILTYVLLGTLLFFKYTMFIKDICHNTCTNNHDTIDVMPVSFDSQVVQNKASGG